MTERERLSLNAYVMRQLEMASRTADNKRLLRGLPDLDVSTDEIVDALDRERKGR